MHVQFILEFYHDLPNQTLFLQEGPAAHNPQWRAWLPCRVLWCKKYSDRWATALLNDKARYLYYKPGGRFAGAPRGGPAGWDVHR